MDKRGKTAIVDLMGAIGLIVIIASFLTNAYDFWTGLLVAIIIWILTGVVKKYWRVEPKKK